MKTKHIIATISGAVIGATALYYFIGRSKSKSVITPVKKSRAGEERIRSVMHHAKDLQTN